MFSGLRGIMETQVEPSRISGATPAAPDRHATPWPVFSGLAVALSVFALIARLTAGPRFDPLLIAATLAAAILLIARLLVHDHPPPTAASSSESLKDVLDSAGQPVVRTDLGKRLADVPRTGPATNLFASRILLAPLKEISSEVDLLNYFKIEPGHAYKVVIRRSKGLPKVDEVGRPLKEIEVSCSFEAPEVGLLRQTPRR